MDSAEALAAGKKAAAIAAVNEFVKASLYLLYSAFKPYIIRKTS